MFTVNQQWAQKWLNVTKLQNCFFCYCCFETGIAMDGYADLTKL